MIDAVDFLWTIKLNVYKFYRERSLEEMIQLVIGKENRYNPNIHIHYIPYIYKLEVKIYIHFANETYSIKKNIR